MDLDEPPEIDAEDPEERREQLKQAAAQHREKLTEEQTDILDAISDEHGGDVIETTVSITPEHTATVRSKFGGRLLDRMGTIEDRMDRWEAYDDSDPHADAPPISDISHTARDMAALLADLIVEDEYDEDLFYGVYEAENLEALGDLFKRVTEALQRERERQAGAVDGFPEQ